MMGVAVLLLVVLATALIVATNAAEAAKTRSAAMGQTEDLRAAIVQLGVDLGEAVDRVAQKVADLGEPDPDLTADIEAIKAVSASLDNLGAADPVPEPDITPPVPITPDDPAGPVPTDPEADPGTRRKKGTSWT